MTAPTDLAAAHRAALGRTGGIVDRIDGGWDRPTPCEGWDVRALLGHIVAGNLWVPELCGGRTIDEVGDRLDGDVLGDDPAAAYRASVEPAAAAFEEPGAMAAPVAVSYGPVPGEVYCGHRFIDVLVHGWDLAVATGQPTELDPDLVDACLDVVRPQAELFAASGMFGSGHEVTGADPQSELLALLGRSG